MKEEIIELRKAHENYVLNDIYELTENLLKYIKERISANQDQIEELIKIRKENFSYNDIYNAVDNEISKDIVYKNYGKMYINKDNFIKTNLLMPIGTIAVECTDTLEVVKYFIKAIKSRNAIAISDVEYDEYDVKSLILVIVKEALSKFEIDNNLIMILPYEECFYDYFDRTIFTYDKEGNGLENNIIQDEEKNIKIEKNYIYIENEKFREIAKNDNSGCVYELVEGDFDKVVETINQKKSNAVSIYTEDGKKAYKFINLVNSENVFVNCSLENIEEKRNSNDEMYEYKNIIIPIPQKEKEEMQANIEQNEDESIKDEQKQEERINENVESNKQAEMHLIKKNETILEKIKRFLKGLF